MRAKNVTMADIAQALGISKNAVSLALRGKDGVSEELRERVVTKAQEMRYHGLGKVQGCILALIPQRLASSESLFYHRLCFDMEAYASSLGYQIIISSVPEIEESLLRPPALLSSVPCMAVVTVGNLSRDYCVMIRKQGLRFVMIDQVYDDVPVDSVTTANSSGSYLMTKHLIDNGHRAIQFLGSSFRTSSLAGRWIGYKRAMNDAGLPILDNSLIQARDITWEDESAVSMALEAMPELPTAFVCGHDITAKYLIDILARRGMHCPEDFSVVGFDNIQSYDVAALNLTTYITPKTAIAHAAIDLLQDTNNQYPRRVEIFGEPVYRASVRDIRACGNS